MNSRPPHPQRDQGFPWKKKNSFLRRELYDLRPFVVNVWRTLGTRHEGGATNIFVSHEARVMGVSKPSSPLFLRYYDVPGTAGGRPFPPAVGGNVGTGERERKMRRRIGGVRVAVTRPGAATMLKAGGHATSLKSADTGYDERPSDKWDLVSCSRPSRKDQEIAVITKTNRLLIFERLGTSVPMRKMQIEVSRGCSPYSFVIAASR